MHAFPTTAESSPDRSLSLSLSRPPALPIPRPRCRRRVLRVRRPRRRRRPRPASLLSARPEEGEGLSPLSAFAYSLQCPLPSPPAVSARSAPLSECAIQEANTGNWLPPPPPLSLSPSYPSFPFLLAAAESSRLHSTSFSSHAVSQCTLPNKGLQSLLSRTQAGPGRARAGRIFSQPRTRIYFRLRTWDPRLVQMQWTGLHFSHPCLHCVAPR